MLLMCLATAPSLTTSAAAMAALERPSAISASTSRSRPVRPASGCRLRAGSWGTTSRSSALPPPGPPGEGVGGLGQIRHPVLEQVADPTGAVGQQLGGVRAQPGTAGTGIPAPARPTCPPDFSP